MWITDELLRPITSANPSGEDLHYAPVYDRIKEARREDDGAPQSDWAHEAKKADWILVEKLATDALQTKSKDLQLAAWLTEALVRRHGFAGLKEGLDYIRALLENFWETLYPQLEDGDVELRAAPLEWVATRLTDAVKRVPLTSSGFDWIKYKESRTVAYEGDCAGSEVKLAARAEAIAEGKLPPEEFDSSLARTPRAFVETTLAGIDGSIESLRLLTEVSDEKFGDEAPNLTSLRSLLEDVHLSVEILLKKKREQEPSPKDVAPREPQQEPAVDSTSRIADVMDPVVASEVAAAKEEPSTVPSTLDDAFQHIIGAAHFVRDADSYSPVSYLVLRALRWGEVRAGGSKLDTSLLDAPPTQTRQQLKRLERDGSWPELIDAAENAMGTPAGRAWLDIQRYVVSACEHLGAECEPIASAIVAELKSLLADYPELPRLSLTDDTPTASSDTQAWLGTLEVPRHAQAAAVSARTTEPSNERLEAARQAVRTGRPQEALTLLTQQMLSESSGRERFRRKIELAQTCLGSGFEHIALPVLRDLAMEIGERRLQEWEDAAFVVEPLVLLLRCLDKLDHPPDEKQEVYERICRLDPAQAIAFSNAALQRRAA